MGLQIQLPQSTVQSKIARIAQDANLKTISPKKFDKMCLRKPYDDLKVAREIVMAVLMGTVHPLIVTFLLACFL